MSARARVGPKTILGGLVALVEPFLPQIISGVWAWPAAWGFSFLLLFNMIVPRLIIARKWPDLIQERMQSMDKNRHPTWRSFPACLGGNFRTARIADRYRAEYALRLAASGSDWLDSSSFHRGGRRFPFFILGDDHQPLFFGSGANPKRTRPDRGERRTVSLRPPPWLRRRSHRIPVHPLGVERLLGDHPRRPADPRSARAHRSRRSLPAKRAPRLS